MTRNGKIARLPHSIRQSLNQRLHDGEQGKALVEWLNDLPEVKEVLQEQFHGRSISEQNLSEWKNGGFKEWERHQEDRHWMKQLAEQAVGLEEDAGDFSVNDRLSVPLTLALGRSIQVIAANTDGDPVRLRLVLQALHELSLQRRCDHSAQRLRLEEERWVAEQEAKKDALYTQMDGEAEAAEHWLEFYLRLLRQQYEEKKQQGSLSSEDETRYQDTFARAEQSRKEPRMRYRHGSFYVQPAKTESDSIKPNPTGTRDHPLVSGSKSKQAGGGSRE